MTPKIEQRIEQIRRGDVPDGYKKTKAGIVPIEWEVKLLSDVFQKQNEKNSTNTVHNVLTNSATQGIVSQTDYFDKQIANDENTSTYYLVYNGCFVYNPRISTNAPCGPFNRYDGIEIGIMSPLYTVYNYKDKSNVYSDYLSFFFSSNKWHGYMNGIANYGARSDRMNVTIEDMNNMPLPYPTLPEQEKIVEILKTQGSMIGLYEKKVEQLKKLKKVFLQKMFPKHGASVPEWRFLGFNDAWKQRKVSDVCSISTGKSNTQDKNDDGEYPFYVRSPNIERSHRYLYDEEAVLTVGDGVGTGKIFHYVKGKYDLHQRVYRLFGFSDDTDAKFFYHWFSENFYDRVMSMTAKTSVDSVRLEMIADMDIIAPSYDEQQKIASHLDCIDNLITLHQRKCDEEKQKKKALMQLLLTGIVRVKV